MNRLVHIIPQDGLGGVETAARSMAARNDLPCDFHILFIAGATLMPGNEHVETTDYRSTANPLAYLATLRRCLALRPDVVLFSLWRSVPLLVALRFLRPRLKLVMTLNLGHSVHGVDAAMFRIGSLLADEVWSDSEASLDARRVQRPHRVISFVSSRIDAPAGSAPSARFVTWARIDRQKRFDLAITFIRQLVDRGHDARFDHYGPDRGERTRLEDMAARLGIADRITFNGPVDHAAIPSVAAKGSFFLLPSADEGMAMACVEAMQLGLVPVVSAVGEMARYVRDGDNGVFVDPARIDVAADKVGRLIADPTAYGAMRSRAVAQWHDTPLYADDICAAASALCRSGNRPPAEKRVVA